MLFMATPYKILIMGASYGSLLGTKLALAGHTVNLVCLPAEADLINSEGAVVRLPVKGRDGLVEINSKKLPGKMSAGGPTAFKPADLPEAYSRHQCRRHPRLLYRSHCLGQLRSRADDAVQSGPAGFPSAGGQGQRAAGAVD